MDQDREISREELHQLIWSKPTSKVAKEFGLSDVGFAKICRKLGVKKPPRGYWAKVASGGRVKKLRLGALPDGCVSKAVIRAKTEMEQMVNPIPRDEVPEISIRENLQGCSRLITVTRVELGKLQPDKYGVSDVRRKPGCLSIAVSEAQVHRTLLILDTLLRELEECGVTVIPVSDQKLSRLVVGSEDIDFYAREQSKQTIDKSSSWDRHIYSPKGQLSLVLDAYPSRAWHERKTKRLEESLGEIVVGALQLAEIVRVRRLEREGQHRRWEEEWRQRELREEARKKDEAKERAFRAEVRKWHLCKMMREYICERERALDDATLEPEPKQRAVEWIAWAKQYVERIDPLNRGFEIRDARGVRARNGK
jgi:hypothetical protein